MDICLGAKISKSPGWQTPLQRSPTQGSTRAFCVTYCVTCGVTNGVTHVGRSGIILAYISLTTTRSLMEGPACYLRPTCLHTLPLETEKTETLKWPPAGVQFAVPDYAGGRSILVYSPTTVHGVLGLGGWGG
jgi:hypothetical protein